MSVPFWVVTPCDVDGTADFSRVPSAFIFRVEVCDMGEYLCIGVFFINKSVCGPQNSRLPNFPGRPSLLTIQGISPHSRSSSAPPKRRQHSSHHHSVRT
jgi:hypothetical protein